jgi:hypothetical protein
LAGADLPEGVEAKFQVFKVTESLVGQTSKADDAIFDYYVVDKPAARERAIRQGERVIWIACPWTNSDEGVEGRLNGLKALPDTPENRKAIQTVTSTAEADLERALPGSRLSIAEAVNRWSVFAVACEAVEGSKDSEIAHLIPGSAGKYQRYRWDVVLSNRRSPSEPFLSYRVWTQQDGPERPIAKGERVIWIGVNPNPGNYRGIKALPDTPENREAVRAAFAKRPASADKYVAITEHADAEQAAKRVALLKRNLDTFRFIFRPMLQPKRPARFLAVRVAKGEDGSGWEKPAISITRQQATRIIDHLATEGLFFRRAANLLEDPTFEPDTAGPTIWLIDNENKPETILVEQVQYGKDDRRMRALRDVLEGDARDAVDGLLAQLESTEQQRDLVDSQPNPQDAVRQSSRTPLAEPRARLRTSLSPLKLLAPDVKYDGEALPRPPDRITGEKFAIDRVAYYRAIMESGLVAEDLATNTARAYRMFDLAIAAGWYERRGNEYLPQDIRGLCRQGNRLWMGSNGVGVLAYDTKNRTWLRYSLQEAPVPGFHVTVLYGDEDYVFATYGYRKEVPTAEPSLHVYSTRQQRWLRIVAVPARDALRLGTSEDLPKVAMGWDHRRFANEPYIPIGGRATLSVPPPNKITRRPDGSFLLRSGHAETASSWTDLVIRPVDLQADFEHFASVPTTGPVAAREPSRRIKP